MQNLQIPNTGETRIIPKWLFPPRFSDENRFTYSCPDAVLVAPISTKTRMQQTSNEGGWVLRSGRGQLRGTGSTSAAPPAISRSTFPRQHRSKYLSILQRDIHPTEIKCCEDTRPQNQLSDAKASSASPFTEPPFSSTPSFCLREGGTIYNSHMLEHLRGWVLILKELNKKASFCPLRCLPNLLVTSDVSYLASSI